MLRRIGSVTSKRTMPEPRKELTPLRTAHIGLMRWTKDQAVDMPFGLCHDVHTPTDRRDAPLRGRTS